MFGHEKHVEQAIKSFAEIYRDSSNNISVLKRIFPVFYHSQ